MGAVGMGVMSGGMMLAKEVLGIAWVDVEMAGYFVGYDALQGFGPRGIVG